ncbi:MAG: hypothetical protein AAB539_01955, partial [Patescibacteria group bacterium]
MQDDRKRKFNRIALGWFRKNGRALPWRRTRDPYRILVSEVMLQQTGVERVLPKYAEFLARFPALEDVAASPLGDVLRVWSGLGYNRRAKYLWECCRKVRDDYGGRFLYDNTELLRLPGVGRSTAAALRAFVFGMDEPMIETNVRRVLSRVFFGGVAVPDEDLRVFAQRLIPKGRGRDWNWAVMDIGALYCKAKAHRPDCPFGVLHGPVSDWIYKKPQTRFAGSRRFYRGRILAALAQISRGVQREKLCASAGLGDEQCKKILDDLVREGLIRCRAGCIVTPHSRHCERPRVCRGGARQS